MTAMPTEPFLAADDRDHRDRRLLRATIWCETIGDQDALIRNLSRDGLGGSVSTTLLSSGMEVTVRLMDGVQVSGTVRWTRGNAFGVRLHQTIEPNTLADELRKQLNVSYSSHKWEVQACHRVERKEEPALPRRPV